MKLEAQLDKSREEVIQLQHEKDTSAKELLVMKLGINLVDLLAKLLHFTYIPPFSN